VARRKNSSFVGASVRDVARDASIYSRVVDNAAGDLQLLYDRLTGENGHTAAELLDHSGGGNGAAISIPLGAQTIRRSLRLAGAGANGTPYYIIVIPVFVPDNGEGLFRFDVDVDTFDDEPLDCEVRTTTWTLDATAPGSIEERVGPTATIRFTLDLAPGWKYLAVRRRLWVDEEDTRAFLLGWRLYPFYFTSQLSNGLAIPGSTTSGNPFPSLGTLTPTVAGDNVIDDAMTAPNSPLDPWVLTRLNRMIGALWEYVTGAPVPGNNVTSLGTTRNHNRANFTAEPRIELPIASVALSALAVEAVTQKSNFIGTLSTSDPIEGPVDFVRYPQTTTSGGSPVVHVVTRNEIWLPPFETGASSTLAARVLIADYSAGGAIGGNWQARFSFGAATSSWVTFTQIGSFRLWVATFSALDYTAGSPNILRLEIQNTSGSASISGQEIVVLSYALAFTP
jgi:hypothetical protein